MTRDRDKPVAAADGGPTDAAADRRRSDALPAAARRALEEAEARRRKQAGKADPPREIGGRGGKDPARFGDWEIDGRAIDF